MPKTKAQKKEILNNLVEKIKNSDVLFFTSIASVSGEKGLSVKDLNEVRKALTSNNISLEIIKKTLLNLALKKNQKENLIPLDDLSGQIALASLPKNGKKDIVDLIKRIFPLTKQKSAFKILGALDDGSYYHTQQIKEMYFLPSRTELLTKLDWLLNSPLNNLLNVLTNNIKGLLNILQRLQTK